MASCKAQLSLYLSVLSRQELVLEVLCSQFLDDSLINDILVFCMAFKPLLLNKWDKWAFLDLTVCALKCVRGEWVWNGAVMEQQ